MGKQYVRRPVGTRNDVRYQIPTVNHGGGNVMVWGMFTAQGVARYSSPPEPREAEAHRGEATILLQPVTSYEVGTRGGGGKEKVLLLARRRDGSHLRRRRTSRRGREEKSLLYLRTGRSTSLRECSSDPGLLLPVSPPQTRQLKERRGRIGKDSSPSLGEPKARELGGVCVLARHVGAALLHAEKQVANLSECCIMAIIIFFMEFVAGITSKVKPKSQIDNYPLVMANIGEDSVHSDPPTVAINGLDNQIAFGVEENPNGEAGLCGSILVFLSWVLIILTMPFSLFVCFKVVQEYERAVIFRLGRLLSGGAKGPGIFFILPCVDNYAKVDLRSSVFDIRPQEVLTKDSVTVSVDAVVYYRVCNATTSVANVENAHHSTRLLAQTTLRNTMGTRLLSEILSERENISQVMQAALDDATVAWGIKVERVEIKDVRLPIQLQRAMAAEAEASREARAKVIAAEGEQKASRALREASEVIGDSPAALQLRYLQTLNTISAEKNSTIVFPVPIDILTYFMKANQARQAQHPF